MKLNLIILTVFCFFSETINTQIYIGEIFYRNSYQYVKIECKDESCKFSMPYIDGDISYSFDKRNLNNDLWEISRGVETWHFSSEIFENKLVGLLSTNTGNQNLMLREQASAIPKNELSNYVGVFQDLKNRRVLVYSRFDYLHIMSPYSEKTMSMKPISESKFWSISGENWEFIGTNEKTFNKLSMTDRFGNTTLLERIPSFTKTEVWIPVNNDTLYGKLFLPMSNEKTPGCLILPGGGGTGLENYEYEARLFAANGIASLIFDKSGNGKSKGTGHFERQTFEEKTNQYISVFQYLQKHPKIDTNKVGIHGPSEGGRLALMMGIDLNNVAFINATAAPIMTMREGQLYAIDHFYRNLNINEIDIIKILTIWNDYYEGIIDGKITPKTIEEANRYRNYREQMFLPPNHTNIPVSPLKEDLINDRVYRELKNINCPVLLQYGENDLRVNQKKSIQNFNTFKDEKTNVTILIYNRSNHSFMTPEFEISQGYADDKINWLKQIGILTKN